MLLKKNIKKNYTVGALLFKSGSFTYRPWEFTTINTFNIFSIYLEDIILEKIPSLNKFRIKTTKSNWLKNDVKYTFESLKLLPNKVYLTKDKGFLLINNIVINIYKYDIHSILYSITLLFNRFNKLNCFNNIKGSCTYSLEYAILLKYISMYFNSYSFNYCMQKQGFAISKTSIFNNLFKQIKFIPIINNILFIIGINLRLEVPEYYIKIKQQKVRYYYFFNNYISAFNKLLYNNLNITNNYMLFVKILEGKHPFFKQFQKKQYVYIITDFEIISPVLKNIITITNNINRIKKYNYISLFYFLNYNSKIMEYALNLYYKNSIHKGFDLLYNINFEVILRNKLIKNSFNTYIIPNNIDLELYKYSPNSLILYKTNIVNETGWYVNIFSNIKYYKNILLDKAKYYNSYTILNYYYNIVNNILTVILIKKNTYYISNLQLKKKNFWIYLRVYYLFLIYISFFNKKMILFKNYLGIIENQKMYIHNKDDMLIWINNKNAPILINNTLIGNIINNYSTTVLNRDTYNCYSINIFQKNSIILNYLIEKKIKNFINFNKIT